MRTLKRAAMVFAGLLVLVLLTAYLLLRGSLPKLEGDIATDRVAAPASIERDSLGVATITATNRNDLAYAMGYAHGQDRFFQMDLMRRQAAGELAALLGGDLVPIDKRFRRHNFRSVAREVIAKATQEEKQVIESYVAGVNAALDAISVRPFEYLVLQSKPVPWTAEDSILVAFAMYIDLNDSLGARELERARLHSALPQAVYDVLYPRGTEWDATLDNVELSRLISPLPNAAAIDISKQPPLSDRQVRREESEYPGSNNWALAGSRTASGGALVANDMHLSFRLPHIWYRARLIVKSSDTASARDLNGVTLPGLPVLVAGSNGRIAWGFTNTHGDYDDLVIVDTDAAHANEYRTGDSFTKFVVRREHIEVRGDNAIDVEYRDTIWGPLLDETLDGKPLALAWTAQRADATNLHQIGLEAVGSVQEALDVANTGGIPVQNFVVADAQGHIGWTPIGRIPKRSGFDGRLPVCWGCAPNVGWSGWVAPGDYPRIVDPRDGQLSTANSRTLGGVGADIIGDEDMDRGARTRQIRDDLLAVNAGTPQDMLKIQLDDRAVFLKRWRDLLMRMQDEAYIRGHQSREAAFKLVDKWSGSASADDPGYRIVRAFRTAMQEDIYSDLTQAARNKYPDAKFRPSARFEDTVWRIITLQPPNLLNPKYERWDLRVLASFDRALAQLESECGVTFRNIGACTWGRRNTLKMEHPLAPALPLVGALLRVPRTELPGDNDMPRVQGVSFGASERFAVSPGHEAEGYLHMPGGQSGHPLSPYFVAGHEAWVKGEPTPFLPGPAQHRLQLVPQH
jgi:penicillin amidase